MNMLFASIYAMKVGVAASVDVIDFILFNQLNCNF